jgi:hypothetical protein
LYFFVFLPLWAGRGGAGRLYNWSGCGGEAENPCICWELNSSHPACILSLSAWAVPSLIQLSVNKYKKRSVNVIIVGFFYPLNSLRTRSMAKKCLSINRSFLCNSKLSEEDRNKNSAI